MKRIIMKRIVLWALALLLIAAFGCAKPQGRQKEANNGPDADAYPYLIRTPYATWYLSKDDMARLGEQAYTEALLALMDDAEADFADVRAVLAGHLPDEVAPIGIYTDFGGKAGVRQEKHVGAYYNGVGNFIKLFEGWDMARAALVHEYVHYLTLKCASPATEGFFWTEGMADYIANFAVKNRLARSVNMGLDPSAVNPMMREQAWDAEENCFDPKLVYIGLGAIVSRGYTDGIEYFCVGNEWIVRRAGVEQDPIPDELTFYEAAGMLAYLTETYGKDTVFGNWNLDPAHADTVYGKSFAELYRDWAAWNEALCQKYGFTLD